MTTESTATSLKTPVDAASPGEPRGLLGRVADSEWFRYLALSGQLAVIFWVIRTYRLEGAVFDKLAVLVWAGFTVHYFLPVRWRLQFFGLLSAAGILVIFGPLPGAWLLGIGLAVIGICHLPIPFAARLAILLSATVVLGAMRVGRIPVPWSAAIWPVLGSMLALRIIVYLYDLKHRNAPFSFWRSVGYFFMLPNAVFPLFPVVDYQTFCRTYDKEKDRTRGYQTGIDWMLRGAVHLLLYRLIYQYLPIETASVTSVPQLLRYLLWPFLLYLNVSGLFHLVIGMLHLFGFSLPETHHLFYLASSFTDFWRRINIYWKDFMLKVFYYPSFFRLRKLGNNVALVLGTFIVFFATWALHSWQWFWLRGSFLLTKTDVLFWVLLAMLVAVNVVIEANRPMKRRLGSGPGPWRESLTKSFKAFGVFVAICLLWSFWSSESPVEWLSLFSVLRTASAADLWLIPAVLGFATVFIVVALYYARRKERPFGLARSVLQNGVVLFVLVLLGSARVHNRIDKDVAGFLGRLKSPSLNPRDAARRQRGYYEKLNDVGWENPELAKVYMVRPPDWSPLTYRPDLARVKPGLPYLELLPNAHGRYTSVEVRFNRWGMRDRDYPPEPEPGTYRIALLGASDSFATGVPQEEGFESLLEERLNREGRLGSYRRAEILNFSTPGYTTLDVLATTEQKALAFKPRALLYVVHQADPQLVITRLSKLLSAREPDVHPDLLQIARSVGVNPGTDETVASRALTPRREEIFRWVYHQLVDRCRAQGVVPIAVYLPLMTPHDYDVPVPTLLGIAREAGFLTADLSDVYKGHPLEKLQIAAWDDHPNAIGHRLIAERLYAAFRTFEDSLWRANENDK